MSPVEAAPTDAAVTVTGLRRTFGGRTPVVALDGVDLVVPARSFTAVLGPSGSGKTTLLRILAGIERADAGTVRIGARHVDGNGRHVGPERRPVGLVPQEGALFPHLDVAGNIGFGLPGRSRAERATRTARVDELLDLVGLPGMRRRRPHELSGGQQQRVALARALAPAPEVVLLDEPFSALDASLRNDLRLEVAALLRTAGATAVLVTHDQDEALAVADHLAVLHDGRIVQHGPPPEVYRRPRDLWVARFLGEAVTLPGELVAGEPPTVRCALGEITAEVPDGSDRVTDVTVFCRPEQVWPAGTGAGRSTGIAATVREVRFGGRDVSVDLDVDGTPITARWPSSLAAHREGDTVDITVLGPVVAFPRT